MKSLSIIQATLLGATLFLVSCSKEKASEEIGFGSYDAPTYTNEYFGMTATMPEGWHFQDKAAQDAISGMGEQMLAGDDKNMKAVLKASELSSVNLFMVFQYPVGEPVPYNPNIVCVAERVSHMPGIKRGSDYLIQAQKLLKASAMEVNFDDTFSTGELGGKSFDTMDASISVSGVTFAQTYYAMRAKGYVLSFISSYSNDEEKALLDGILDSVTFTE